MAFGDWVNRSKIELQFEGETLHDMALVTGLILTEANTVKQTADKLLKISWRTADVFGPSSSDKSWYRTVMLSVRLGILQHYPPHNYDMCYVCASHIISWFFRKSTHLMKIATLPDRIIFSMQLNPFLPNRLSPSNQLYIYIQYWKSVCIFFTFPHC